MGYGPGKLELVLNYLPKNGSVIDLGAQMFHGVPKRQKGYVGKWFVENGYKYTSMDIHPGPFGNKIDFNRDELCLVRADVITNFGTSEHIFNQLAVFRFIHNACELGGVMIHDVPFARHKHGFFNYDLRLFKSLAIANDYEVLELTCYEEYILVVFRSVNEDAFTIPMDTESR